MRYIRKITQPTDELLSRNLNPPQNPDEASNKWGDGRFNKGNILDRLLYDQYYLCCYCELRADEYGIGYHIEHVENKSQNPQRTFDYSNLAASAFKSGDEIKNFYQDRNAVFGGHAFGKVQGVDINRFISPYQSNCADYFIYSSDGRVSPNPTRTSLEQNQASYTIDLLNLNSPVLITLREEKWKELDDLYEEHADLDGLNHWLEIELLPRRNNGRYKLESFFTLKRQFFGNIAEDLLKNYKNGALK